MFAFADAEIIQLAKTVFVPVCADDWYQRRRRDAEGRFWKAIVRQGPRAEDASTHQGIYLFSADGELLSFKNAGNDAKATREQLASALRKWNDLPADRRAPGAVAVEDHGPLDPDYGRTPPAGGLVARVHARILDRQGDGYAKGACDFLGGDKSARDFLWLTAADVAAMAPAKADVGYAYPLPPAVADRIVRFHLVDNTRGEPEFWAKDEVRSQSLTLTVTAATPDAVTLRLDGEVKLATATATADRGYEAKLHGELRYVPAAKAFDRFEVVALGEHWGTGRYTTVGGRPGRGLFGVALGLADPSAAADRVAPQGARDLAAYFGRD